MGRGGAFPPHGFFPTRNLVGPPPHPTLSPEGRGGAAEGTRIPNDSAAFRALLRGPFLLALAPLNPHIPAMFSAVESGRAAALAEAPWRLAVTRLTLTDFRCYGAARIEADGRPLVL